MTESSLLAILRYSFFFIFAGSMIREHLHTSNTSGQTNSKEYIVLHHTGTSWGSIRGVLNHLTTWPVSCHYVIDTNGDIYQINTDDDVLWHCGESFWEWRSNINRYSIGIEIIGPLPWFTDLQRYALRSLVAKLSAEYSIPVEHIIRHRDIAPGRKADPADTLWNQQFANYGAFQQSFVHEDSIKHIMWYYERLFHEEFADIVDQDQTIIQDIAWAAQRLRNPDGSVNLQELTYFITIGFERLHKQIHHLPDYRHHDTFYRHPVV